MKARNIDPKDIRLSPHITYYRHLDRLSRAVANKQDPGPLINMLLAMLAHAIDDAFIKEWNAIHAFTISGYQTESTLSIWEVRVREYAALVRLMKRRNMLEESRVKVHV